jgi:hypothetical protein
MNEALTHFYTNQPEPAQSCLLALRAIILAYDGSMAESISYGMPLFTCQGKRLCYLWMDKKTNWPYILVVDGHKINHPALAQGNRKRMKVLLIDPTKDIPIKIIQEVFDRIKAQQ